MMQLKQDLTGSFLLSGRISRMPLKRYSFPQKTEDIWGSVGQKVNASINIGNEKLGAKRQYCCKGTD